MSQKKFTLYWLDGKRQVITGETIEQAYTTAGYGAGAIKAVDFYFDGDNNEYVWNSAARSWDRIQPLPIAAMIPVNNYKYKLFVSYNLGATYMCEHSTDDKNDPELNRLIAIAQQRSNRYYLEGDDSVVCQQHRVILDVLGNSPQQRSIEEQAALLRNKFSK